MRFLVLDVETVAIDDAATYLEPVSAPANYKNPDAIEKYILEETQRQKDRAALDIDLARIVALGWKTEGQDVSVSLIQNEDQERHWLRELWGTFFNGVNNWHTCITFNGMAYDVPLLLRRSLYLGVKAPKLQLDRYKHPEVIDLMALLNWDGRLKSHSLRFYANRFGIPVNDELTGADIGQAVTEEKWDAVEQHCRADVQTTYALAVRMGVL
jgi:predicted PolB exonuclease-like 3'-5' exonuclease